MEEDRQRELRWDEGVLDRTSHDRNYRNQARPGRLLKLLGRFPAPLIEGGKLPVLEPERGIGRRDFSS
jgi:hypothetical protein